MPATNVPTYPNMFDPSQMVNKYSDWNDVKYQMAVLPTTATDALGNTITPPPGVTLTGPHNWGLGATPNYYPYIQTLANPNKVITPGIAPAQQNNNLAPGGSNFASILHALQQQQQPGQNAPGYTPPPANPSIPWSAAGAQVPGVTLGGGSSNVFGGGAGGLGGNYLSALQALQGAPGGK